VILSGEEVTLHICRFETIVSFTVKMDADYFYELHVILDKDIQCLSCLHNPSNCHVLITAVYK